MWGGGEWGDQLHQLFSLGRSGAGKLLRLPELLVLPRAGGRAGSSGRSELPGTLQRQPPLRFRAQGPAAETFEKTTCPSPRGLGSRGGSCTQSCWNLPKAPAACGSVEPERAREASSFTDYHHPPLHTHRQQTPRAGDPRPQQSTPCAVLAEVARHRQCARATPRLHGWVYLHAADPVAAARQDLPPARGAPCRTHRRGAGPATGSSAC